VLFRRRRVTLLSSHRVEGEQFLGSYAHPEISTHTHSLAEHVKHIREDEWRCVGELILSSANKLANCGANFLICPGNTIHQALPFIETRSPLPFLHIADAVAGEAIGTSLPKADYASAFNTGIVCD
jgi:aspartate racemase